MHIIFNSVIALLIVFITTLIAFHYYPTYQPQSEGAWVALVGVSTLVIVVAEALVDGAGLYKEMPKTQRFFLVAIGCACIGVCGLAYMSHMRGM